MYVRRRPFHPRRLFEFIYDKFILQHPEVEEEEEGDDDDEMEDEEWEDEEEDTDAKMEDTNDLESGSVAASDSSGDASSSVDRGQGSSAKDSASSASSPPASEADMEDKPDFDLEIPDPAVVLASKKADALLSRLFRSKGEYWLATRPNQAGEWSQAGAMLTLAGGRKWFCLCEKEEYETGSPEIDAMVLHDIEKGGEWGDRRQEIVFIGEGLNIPVLEARLDKCLLNDEEWKHWQVAMRGDAKGKVDGVELLNDLFDDGFPDWPEDEEVDHNH